MLMLSKTQIFGSVERAANAANLPNIFEGAALQTVVNTATGIGECLLTDGGTSDVFAGVALVPLRFPTISSFVEVDTVPASAPYTITLQNLAAANTQIGVFNATTMAEYVYVAGTGTAIAGTSFNTATVTNSQGYQVTQLSFAAGDAGVQLNIVYRRVLSYSQAATLFGDQYYRMAPDATATLSVITHGVIYTDAFDPTSNFTTTPLLKVVSGGLFAAPSSTLTGTALNDNLQVISVPTVAFPYLGFVIK